MEWKGAVRQRKERTKEKKEHRDRGEGRNRGQREERTDLRSGCCTGSQRVGWAVENSLETRQSALFGGQAATSSLERKWSYEQSLQYKRHKIRC